jgi:4-carboxymuconolactone decarboxylase
LKLTRKLFVAASLLLSGEISTMANAQSQPPAASDTAPAQQQSRAQQLYGDIAPKMAELTDNVLYGDIWERPGLSKRDRSLVTIAALIALNRPDQLRSHINLGHQNGLTKDEIVETITHMAFYSGWPSAVSSLAIAKEVFQK